MIAIASTTWPTKFTGEKITVEFDFGPDLSPGDAIDTVQFVLTVVSGIDAAPGSLINGSPVIKGARVFQRLQDGLEGCSYLVECRVTTAAGNLLIIARVLPVVALI